MSRPDPKAARFSLHILNLEDRCVPATQIVTSDADLGPGTLREAITAINASTDPANDISFSGYFNSAKTILLDSVLPSIAVPLTITGTTTGNTNLVTISGQQLVNIFDTTAAPTNATIEFKNLILTKGSAAQPTDGGAVSADDENITITSCLVSSNTAQNGGAINLRGNQTLTVRNSVVSGNTANTLSVLKGGGAFYLGGVDALLDITNSTLSGNQSSFSGGVANMYNGGNLSLLNSTVSGNSAGNLGGGFYSFNTGIPPRTFLIRNSTIAANTSNSSGSAVCSYFNSYGTFDILNSTISGNISNESTAGGYYGGAICVGLGYGQMIRIKSSVVSGNTQTAGDGNDDLAIDPFAATLSVENSAIGTNNGFTINGTNIGNLPFGTNLMLGSLANNGGTTETLAISSPSSPLVNTGSNPAPILTTDQRGGSFARTIGGFTDIGAFELQTAPAAPVVSGFVVNGSPNPGTQRSRLTQVVVSFTASVDVSQFQSPGAVKFIRTGLPTNNQGTIGTEVNTSNGLLISPSSGNSASLTLTFANLSNAGLNSGSLADGRWQLSIVPAGNYLSPNGNTDTQLRRLFGDTDNNGAVDGTDFGAFPPFGNAANNPFDFDNNGTIDGNDFSAFGGRFGYSLA